jgi:hypothetical protein
MTDSYLSAAGTTLLVPPYPASLAKLVFSLGGRCPIDLFFMWFHHQGAPARLPQTSK